MRQTNSDHPELIQLILQLREALTKEEDESDEINQILTKTNRILQELNEDQLAAVLLQPATAGNYDGANGLYYLMTALENATTKKNLKSVAAISNQIQTIFEKLTPKKLAEGLSKAITAGYYPGTNGLHRLMLALYNAVSKNNLKSVAAISNQIQTIFEKLTREQLAEGLSKAITAGYCAGTNGLHRLILALYNAVSKNNLKSVTAISNQIQTIFEKLTREQLAEGLSKAVTARHDAGANGLYYLMTALDNATTKKNLKSVAAISNQIQTIFEKLTPEQLAGQLAGELWNRVTEDDFKDGLFKNGLYWLMQFLDNKTFHSDANPNPLMEALIDWLTKINLEDGQLLNIIFKYKTLLMPVVLSFLDKRSHDEILKFTESKTALGKLIDYQRHNFAIFSSQDSSGRVTASREKVNLLIVKVKAKSAALSFIEKDVSSITQEDIDKLISVLKKARDAGYDISRDPSFEDNFKALDEAVGVAKKIINDPLKLTEKLNYPSLLSEKPAEAINPALDLELKSPVVFGIPISQEAHQNPVTGRVILDPRQKLISDLSVAIKKLQDNRSIFSQKKICDQKLNVLLAAKNLVDSNRDENKIPLFIKSLEENKQYSHVFAINGQSETLRLVRELVQITPGLRAALEARRDELNQKKQKQLNCGVSDQSLFARAKKLISTIPASRADKAIEQLEALLVPSAVVGLVIPEESTGDDVSRLCAG